MARKGILPRRKRGRASTASTEVDDVNSLRQINAIDVESCNSNAPNIEQS